MKDAVLTRPTLRRWLGPGQVILDLRGNTRHDVLQELVSRIPGVGHKSPAAGTVLKALETREQLGSTALCGGVAFPHTREPVLGREGPPVLIFGRHRTGLDYHAADGQPVRLFFLLIAPQVGQHLQVLAGLSRLCRKPDVRDKLLMATSPGEVREALAEEELPSPVPP